MPDNQEKANYRFFLWLVDFLAILLRIDSAQLQILLTDSSPDHNQLSDFSKPVATSVVEQPVVSNKINLDILADEKSKTIDIVDYTKDKVFVNLEFEDQSTFKLFKDLWESEIKIELTSNQEVVETIKKLTSYLNKLDIGHLFELKIQKRIYLEFESHEAISTDDSIVLSLEKKDILVEKQSRLAKVVDESEEFVLTSPQINERVIISSSLGNKLLIETHNRGQATVYSYQGSNLLTLVLRRMSEIGLQLKRKSSADHLSNRGESIAVSSLNWSFIEVTSMLTSIDGLEITVDDFPYEIKSKYGVKSWKELAKLLGDYCIELNNIMSAMGINIIFFFKAPSPRKKADVDYLTTLRDSTLKVLIS